MMGAEGDTQDEGILQAATRSNLARTQPLIQPRKLLRMHVGEG